MVWSTPLPSYVKLSLNYCSKSDAKRIDMAKVPYCSTAVGSLMYANICTRLDIAYAMGVASRYMSNPSKKHWEAMKGVMHSLKSTREMHICFGSKEACVEGYTDADYAEDVDKQRSMLVCVNKFIWWCSFMSILFAKLCIYVNY